MTGSQLSIMDLQSVQADKLPELLKPAADLLYAGGVIAYPTETVYGLGANIFKEAAVERLFNIKQRDAQKPFSIMISKVAGISDLCTGVPENARIVMQRYWPGPITLVLKASQNVPCHIRSPEGKIGVRIPNHPVAAALMKVHSEPITTTSANLSGQPAGVSAEQITETLGEKVDLIIDGGRCESTLASTVVDFSSEQPALLREGVIPFEEILSLIQ